MVEATKKLNEKLDEITNLLIGEMNIDSISEMSEADVMLMRSVCGLIKEFKFVMMKQATVIESQNVKIDELLRLVKTLTQK